MPQIAIIHQQVSQDFNRGDFLAGLQKLDDLICSGMADLQTWALTGTALLKVREYAQALDAWSHAVDLDAANTQAYLGLARAHYYLGEVSQAVSILRRILQQSDNLEACTILAIICPGDPETSPAEILSIRRQFDQLASRTIGEQLPGWQNRPCNLGRLRIGYVSAYFHQANYMRPVRPLINAHHTDQFEIHLFADDATSSSFDWLKNPSATVHLVTDLDNVQLIQKIRQQNLDILIDLNGYSVPSRLPIYTHRLAQQVAAWFNMYATSGLRCIDYLIGDPWVLNDHETSHYSERLIKLPTSYLSFGAQFDAPEVFQRPAECGLHSTSTNRFTFGSLVSQYKITDQVLQTWAKILRSVPSAKLSLANRTMQSTSNREYLKARLARFGVSESQYEFLPPADHFQFLEYYANIDLALDAFPYNGGTTTTEALWQGVPVLCLDGDRWASRTSKTLLANCSMDRFIARDEEEFHHLACTYATDPKARLELAELRNNLRRNISDARICDTGYFTQRFEDCLRTIASSPTR